MRDDAVPLNPPAPLADPVQVWSVYILHCDRQVLYTGISTDVMRRLREHVQGSGARSLRRYTTLELAYAVVIGRRGQALQVEYRIKQLSAVNKRRLVAAQPDRSGLLQQLGLDTVASLA